MTAISLIVLGLLYPLAMTGIAQVLFRDQANGSIVYRDGRAVGSRIVGQQWTKPQYFHSRPSAAGNNGYDPTQTGGTNLGPTSKKLIDATRATIAALREANPGAGDPPMDLVTSSGSGIDPDISPDAAYYQSARVAAARNVPVDRVRALIASHVEGRAFGILGEPRVNVLQLNLDLDAAGR